MFRFKKGYLLITMIFIQILCISFGGISYAVTDSSSSQIENEMPEYGLLNALKVTDGELNENVVLTRAMLARISAGVAVGELSGTAELQNRPSDVSDEEKYTAYINYVLSSGIMKCKNGNLFAPDDAAEGNEVIAALTAAIGYRDLSETEVMKYASRSGITKNLSIGGSKVVYLKDAYKAAYNALHAYAAEEKYYSDKVEYFTNGKTTQLEKVFGIIYTDGTFYTSEALTGEDDNYVSVGSMKINIEENKDYSSLNGYYVRAYYEKNSSDFIYADMTYFKNEVYYVYANDIEKVENGKLYYVASNGKTVQVSINNDKVVYNGYLCDNVENLFNIKLGYIMFINKGSSNQSIIINEYENMLVGGKYKDTVYSLDETGFSIDFEKYESYKIISGDAEGSMSDIAKNDVLSLYVSADRRHITAQIGRNTLKGAVSGIESDYITVGENKLRLTDYFKKYYSVKPGDKGLFRLDVNGGLVAFSSEGSWNYGYFMGAKPAYSFIDTAQLKVLNSSGKIEILNISEKVDVNGTRLTSPDLIKNDILTDALKTLAYATDEYGKNIQFSKKNDFVYQIIKYKVNGENEITAIRTAVLSDSLDDDKLIIYEAGNKKANNCNLGHFYSDGGSAFLDLSATQAFNVPITEDNYFGDDNLASDVDESRRDASNEKAYKANNYGQWKNEILTIYSYDISESGMAKCMVSVNYDGAKKAAFSGGDDVPIIVTEMGEAINSEGEVTQYIHGFQGEKEVQYNLETDFNYRKDSMGYDIKPDVHDLIYICRNSYNEITDFKIGVDYDKKNDNDNGGLNTNHYGYIWANDGDDFGRLALYDNYGFKIKSVYPKNDTVRSWKWPNTKLYVYDPDNKTVTIGDKSLLLTENMSENPSYMYIQSEYGRSLRVFAYIH